MTTALTTRVTTGTGATVKGSPLTNAEIDNNFISLNDNKVETGDAVSTATANKVVKRDANADFAANVITVTNIKTGSTFYPTTNATQAEMEAGTETNTRFTSPATVKNAIDVLSLKAMAVVGKDTTGFESLAGSSLSYVDATRVFTLGTSTTYNVWFKGAKSTITTNKTITLTNTPGLHLIVLNPTTLVLEEWSDGSTVFTDTIFVASIYLNTGGTKGLIIGDERHSAARDTTWHVSEHNNTGAQWRSGGSMSYTLNSDTATTVSISTPIVLADEDLVHTITHNPTPTGYFNQVLNGSASLQTLYLNGTTYDYTGESTTPWAVGSGTARYNPITGGSGALSDAGEGKYINYWIIATNDIMRPIKAVMGRVVYSALTECSNEQFVDYGLPFLECAPMYQVTLLTSGSFAGNKVKIVQVRTITQRQSAITQNFKTTAHNELSSLAGDDHAQYVHISTARTISANHTFSGSNTFTGTNTFNRVSATDVSSNWAPAANATYDLGSTTNAWRNVYTNDLHLSNEGHESGNVVDGTKGNWTVQEGAENLYIINNKTGRKFKFALEEIK